MPLVGLPNVGFGSRWRGIGADGDGRPDVGRWTGLTLWLLRASGEPWLWSIRPDELPRFLSDAGWTFTPELTEKPGKCGVEFHAVASR